MRHDIAIRGGEDLDPAPESFEQIRATPIASILSCLANPGPILPMYNDCDPLCDEGIDFYQLLLREGAPPSGDGDDPGNRGVPGCLPRDQPGHREEPRGVLQAPRALGRPSKRGASHGRLQRDSVDRRTH